MKVHHTGMIVESIEKSLQIYETLGYVKESEIVIDTIQNNRILFLQNAASQHRLELIEKLNEKSSVYNFKPGLHHICYETDRDENFTDYFKSLKIGKIFTKPIAAPAIGQRLVLFAYLKDGSLVEFLLS